MYNKYKTVRVSMPQRYIRLLSFLIGITFITACNEDKADSVESFNVLVKQAIAEIDTCSGNPALLNVNRQLSTKFLNDSTKLSPEDKRELITSLSGLAVTIARNHAEQHQMDADLVTKGIEETNSHIRAIVETSTTLGELVKRLNNE